MALKPDYEDANYEGVYIKQSERDCDNFYKNYRHFGWEFVEKVAVPVYDDNGKRYSDTDLYRITIQRNKNLVNYDDLVDLETKFQIATNNMNVRNDDGVFGKKVDPDYIDYESDKPIMEEYKLGVVRAVINTVFCFCGIGVLLWLDSLWKLSQNGKARKVAQIKDECRNIFAMADALE